MSPARQMIFRFRRSVRNFAFAIAYTAFFLPFSSKGQNGPLLMKQICWSTSTNSIIAGVLVTNAFGVKRIPGTPPQLEFDLWLRNRGTPNQKPFYIPDEKSRFSIKLFDSQGKAVEPTALGASTGNPLPPVISPKEFAAVKHLVLLRDSDIHWAGSVRIEDYFKIERPGKYRCEIELRYFQIVLRDKDRVGIHRYTAPVVNVEFERP